jgi:MSHA pilin protein MshD
MMAMVIVATMMLAAMRSAGASARAHYQAAQRSKAHLLATALMAELLQASYEEPRGGTGFGPDAGETATSKTNYNDVDDYDGWSESPPQDRDGTPISGYAGWQRSVVVERVDPNNLTQVSAIETGAKRITLAVRYNGSLIASHISIRTKAP